MRVKIISIYYGKFPSWFELWLLSCSYNSEFDFLIITDQMYNGVIPKNVEIKQMQWEILQQCFSHAAGMPVVLEKPYKLCDYRPLYGLAFEEMLRGYDFWGHCDLDMIFGNLKEFITEEILAQYDRVGMYGALTLYKNKSEINSLFKKRGASFSWKTVFSNSENFIFDEMPGMNCICLTQNVKWYKDIHRSDIDTYLKRMGADLIVGHEIFTWERGIAKHYYIQNDTVVEDKVAYIHFSGKKPKLEDKLDESSNVVIHANCIETLNEYINSVKQVEKYSEFISEFNDLNQRKQAKLKKWDKFRNLCMKHKIIRLVNALYIRKFYSKI